MKQNVRNILIVLAMIVVGIQFVPIRGSNPKLMGEIEGEIEAEPEIAAILERSCYDCHSNESHWPWYSRVAPVSWWIVHHVDEAREEMNFSEWDKFSEKQQGSVRAHIWEEVEEGEMPLKEYLWLHDDAKLSGEDLALLRAWAGVEDTDAEHDHADH